LYRACRELRFESINLDLVYGLPRQSPERFDHTVARVAALRPDRVAIYSYAHLPRARPHQKRIDANELPPAEVKLELFRVARRRLLEEGYVAIGMDHFALPGDELVHAMHEHRLQRNFMGYTARMGTDMIGLGLSAIGDVAGCYVQNARKLSTYRRELQQGRLPVERGRVLDADDEIRRAVILDMMCNFRVEPSKIEDRFGIDFESYFAHELGELRSPGGLVDEGFVEIDASGIGVVGRGRLFVRNAAMIFDRYLHTAHATEPVFSRTV
jgi:oxygen-independent coproporphyrinogen-3 oxidase